MRRREFILALGGAAAWPLPLSAQQPAMPVVGFLNTASPAPFNHLVAAFRSGLEEAGFVEGRNVALEFRWADGRYERLPALAAELVQRSVAVLATSGGDPALLAARAATTTIPIVFLIGSDPVELGYVASFNKPGGNLTGVHQLTAMLGAKRLGLLREVAPRAALMGVLINPSFPPAAAMLKDAEKAAASLGIRVLALNATTESEFEPAFSTLAREQASALLIGADPFFNSRRDLLVALAARYRVPTIYEFREFALAGGLMSYGTSLSDSYRQAGNYAGRLLKGARPAELPIVQSSKFELVVNLKTAKALGLEVPPGLLTAADEVIE
ncbi:MAG: ABC transporter substrate-binding protein [Xanthobacteraceae bacterium]|jgi:putative tryptophan/tyrosine transport system substrate-binding protein